MDSSAEVRVRVGAMTLDCQMCGETTVLSEAECSAIKRELSALGVSAAHTHECSGCHMHQFILCLRTETPKWNLVEAGR